MEPKPPTDHVFIYRLGNSSALFQTQPGNLELISQTKNVWPAQNFTLVDNQGRTRFTLDLSEAQAQRKCGYVVGLFDMPDSNVEGWDLGHLDIRDQNFQNPENWLKNTESGIQKNIKKSGSGLTSNGILTIIFKLNSKYIFMQKKVKQYS